MLWLADHQAAATAAAGTLPSPGRPVAAAAGGKHAELSTLQAGLRE
ncbi:MAG TPA: hypothetical protein VI365_20595 [Trebonia sp.]